MAINDVKEGKVFTGNDGIEAVVINYINSSNVLIKHFDAHATISNVTSGSLRRGKFSSPYSPTLCGIGFIGIGDFAACQNYEISREYSLWSGMMKRCYDKRYHIKNPRYKGCTVSEDWHNFQNFAEWLDNHEFSKDKGYQVDKDIINQGNKIYSAENCTLVPQEINKLLITRGAKRGKYLIGASLVKATGKFVSQMSVNGRVERIGLFSTELEAHQAYVIAKEAYVKVTAIEYKDRIEQRVFDALMNWSYDDE